MAASILFQRRRSDACHSFTESSIPNLCAWHTQLPESLLRPTAHSSAGIKLNTSLSHKQTLTNSRKCSVTPAARRSPEALQDKQALRPLGGLQTDHSTAPSSPAGRQQPEHSPGCGHLGTAGPTQLLFPHRRAAACRSVLQTTH